MTLQTLLDQAYCENDNYLIVYDHEATSHDYCAVYFSSHDIYFPNTPEAFNRRIVQQNFFEWYNTRFHRASKHIFLRDVYKQWFLNGINSNVNSPELLLQFLQCETAGMRVLAIGCSAGGYAATLYGLQLGAERIIAINAQFELESVLHRSTPEKNPLLFKYSDTPLARFYDLSAFLNLNSPSLYYFCSARSPWDVEQLEYIEPHPFPKRILFRTAHHGVPFLKAALPAVMNLDAERLQALTLRHHSPYLFTLRYAGVLKTVSGLLSQGTRAIYKRIAARFAS